MATERRRQLMLGALVVVLLVVIYRLWTVTSPEPVAASNRSGGGAPAAAATRAGRGAGTTAAQGEAPDVHLEALDAERVRPGAGERNLFRFKPPPPPPPPPPPKPVQTAPVNTAPPQPNLPPPVPPITLKFIGIIESPTHARKIAVLSDGRNPPFQGEEGAIIEGRYRILKIGVESVELAYVDGRGRQTIRLTGS